VKHFGRIFVRAGAGLKRVTLMQSKKLPNATPFHTIRGLDSRHLFVITAEREARRGVIGSADNFLAQRPQEMFFITFTVAGELA
jgi:hypothetical protein